MGCATSKTKIGQNYSIVVLTLFGYVVTIYSAIYSKNYFHAVPYPVFTVGYYSIVALLTRRPAYLVFLWLSFILLSFYFSIITYSHFSIDVALKSLTSGRFAITTYSYLLIPFSFIGISMDFYALPKELSGISRIPVLNYFVAVLIKKELITHRYNLIMDAFYARGLDTHKGLNKYRYLFIWIIPLVVTTLMEGVESYEYNKTLGTDITALHAGTRFTVSSGKLLILAVFFIAILVGIILKVK